MTRQQRHNKKYCHHRIIFIIITPHYPSTHTDLVQLIGVSKWMGSPVLTLDLTELVETSQTYQYGCVWAWILSSCDNSIPGGYRLVDTANGHLNKSPLSSQVEGGRLELNHRATGGCFNEKQWNLFWVYSRHWLSLSGSRGKLEFISLQQLGDINHCCGWHDVISPLGGILQSSSPGDGVAQWVQRGTQGPKNEGSNPACVRSARNNWVFSESKKKQQQTLTKSSVNAISSIVFFSEWPLYYTTWL